MPATAISAADTHNNGHNYSYSANNDGGDGGDGYFEIAGHRSYFARVFRAGGQMTSQRLLRFDPSRFLLRTSDRQTRTNSNSVEFA